jgi:Dolichyl-phosphate-mannose-protein mannosyltransferase
MMYRDTAQAAPNPEFDRASRRVSVERRISLAIALLLLSSFFVQGVAFIRANSQTYDEAAHLVAGYSYLATGDFRLGSDHPPLIKELQALPLLIRYRLPFNPDPQRWQREDAFGLGLDFLYRSAVPADQMLLLARLSSLLIGAWLIALVGWWAYRLWGREAALLAIALASFDPTLIAHSSLVKNDVGVSAAMLTTLYLLWEYVNRPCWRLLVGTGLAAGIAFTAKYTALVLLPITVLIAFILIVIDTGFALPRNNPRRPMDQAIQAAAALAVIFSISLLVIPPVYLVHSTDTWWSGLQRLLTITRDGQPSFYFGDYSYNGWWSYHLMAFLIKTPVGTLVLFGLSLGLQTPRTRLTWRTAAFLVAPIIVVCAVTTQSKLATGLRHILPIYPFVFILAGRVAALRGCRRLFALFLIIACVVFTALSSLRVAPHQLAYFNELVGGPNRGHRYLLDSNLDWGQDLKAVKAYMEREKVPIIYLSYFGTAPPSYYGIRYQFVPGTWPLEWPGPMERVPAETQRKLLAISVNNLQDLAKPSYPLFQWLRQREPIAKLGYSIFIYDLTGDRTGLANLEETYYKAGLSPP